METLNRVDAWSLTDAEHERHGFHVLSHQFDVVGGHGKHPVPEGFSALLGHLVHAGEPAYGGRAETAQERPRLETGIENVQAKTAGGYGVTDAFHPVDGATDAAVVATEHLCVVLTCRTIAVCTRGHFGNPLGQLWSYRTEHGARAFFERWKQSLRWQRLEPYRKFAEMIERHWDGIAAYCRPENKVSLGMVEGLNNKIRVIQRSAYGYRDEEYLRLKVIASFLPPLPENARLHPH